MYIWLCCGILFLLIVAVAVKYLKYPKKAVVQSYEECVKQSDSKILETYPQQCFSPGNGTFTQPITPTSAMNNNAKNVPYEIVTHGTNTKEPFQNRDYRTIANDGDYKALMTLIGTDQIPSVNFDTNTLLAVFAGTKNTGGYSTEINLVTESADSIQVEVLEKEPSPDCMTTQAVTSPYQIVKIAKTTKPIRFNTTQKIVNCTG